MLGELLFEEDGDEKILQFEDCMRIWALIERYKEKKLSTPEQMQRDIERLNVLKREGY